MTPLSRRQFVHASLAIAALSGGGLLSGCGGGSSSDNPTDKGGANGGDAVPAPTYRPLENGPKPDIAGDVNIPDTFFNYPSDPFQSVTEMAGDGKPVSILTQTFSPVTAQPPKNTAWQNLNDKIGSELTIQQIPAGEYSTKFSTTLAGQQLPDMFFIAEVSDMPAMVQATCLDLSDHLSGDAILKYPNLAAIPTDAWEAGRFGGRLYGLPSPRGAMSSGILYKRDDMLKAKGIDGTWGSFQEFFDLAKEINDPRGGVWASTSVPGQYIKNMLGMPNFWNYDGKTMQSWWMVPEMEQALEAQRSWVEAGLMNPDAFSSPNTKLWFSTGKGYFNPDAFTAWAQYWVGATSGFDFGGCEIPAFEGGGDGHMWVSFPSFGRSAINKNAGDRVETLLKVANYLAAPFGTQEFLDVKYGKEGVDYTLNGSDPEPTPAGGANSQIGVKYIVDAKVPNYLPGHKESAQKLDTLIRALMPNALYNDAVYLYSKEQEKNFAEALTEFGALEGDIVQGRKQVSDWKPAADKWWKDHGQKMADELAQAYVDAGRKK
ncbi:type 2 periplasmic-binding domain-containing protein [Tessaracoccus antarcticus]|uniref:Extracellular solute-binding protein n=1 Tax=Tessaracoccus antarcticus TaxID=2479848 RepID=A0A3M0G9J2_9ACTN|nr:extracellular solute-binding protein [Tessaracoccus antarcticus]RMB57779.1 hypothetical protein EAX62_15055 [Tessaracoccus antarcticus]